VEIHQLDLGPREGEYDDRWHDCIFSLGLHSVWVSSEINSERVASSELKPLSRKAPSSLYEGRTYLELIRAPDIHPIGSGQVGRTPFPSPDRASASILDGGDRPASLLDEIQLAPTLEIAGVRSP